MTKDIYAPGIGEEIQIGQQTNSFAVALSESLIASVRMSRVCPYVAFAVKVHC